MFKRRIPKGYLESFSQWIYPRGGWSRATRYVLHRLRRLPDPAHKISRGIAVGVFISFTPLFGLHFILATILAIIMRGNILAAILATFFGNPLTFPLIATASVELGSWLLGKPHVPLQQVLTGFSFASLELWANLKAVFTPAPVRWIQLSDFMDSVFVPYLIGGLIPGVICGLLAYILANPIIASYQRGRIKKIKERFERRRKALEEARQRKAESEKLESEDD